MTRISCHQLALQVGDFSINRELCRDAIHAAVDAGAEVIVLPELATSGYMFDSRAEAEHLAIPPDHAIFDDWAAEARRGNAVVIGGFCELGSDGLLYDSAALIDGSGVRVVYRKTHLWDREKLVFEPGKVTPPVVETHVGRIGLLICYDLEFPELTRTLALAGADLITAPTNWPLVDRPPGERPPEVTIAMAAARTNRVFIACCDREGVERGQEWTAGTVIINESGWVLATAEPHGTAVADIDLLAARNKTLTLHSDALGDRRPDLYHLVTAQPRTMIQE